MYEPFLVASNENEQAQTSTLRLLKTPVHAWAAAMSAEAQTGPVAPMRVISDIGGYSTIYIPGDNPGFLLRSAACSPKYIRLRDKPVKWMSGFHSKDCVKGWVYVNNEVS